VIYFIGLYTVTEEDYAFLHGLMALGLAGSYLGLGLFALARKPAGTWPRPSPRRGCPPRPPIDRARSRRTRSGHHRERCLAIAAVAANGLREKLDVEFPPPRGRRGDDVFRSDPFAPARSAGAAARDEGAPGLRHFIFSREVSAWSGLWNGRRLQPAPPNVPFACAPSL
jgi:hypothetical protein